MMSSVTHRALARAAGLCAPVAHHATSQAANLFSTSRQARRGGAPAWFRLTPLALALSWPLPAIAQETTADTAEARESADERRTAGNGAIAELPTITVEASPFGRDAETLVQPVDVISGEELERLRGGTIGDMLGNRPGVSNASFGPGVGRPVIRGQGGPRVQILDNGIGSMDASSISADHAVSVDPLNAQQVEIIKGPATLIYGGSASAGLVNVVDDRLPDEVTPGLAASGNFSYGSNADEKNRSARLRYGSGPWQFGTQYALRTAGDFSVPGYAVRQHEESEHADEEEHDHEEDAGSFNRLDNSSLRTESLGASTAFVGSRGMLGAAVTRFETNYGVPGHAHEHEHEEEAHEEEEEEAGHSEEGVRIDLEQTRVDLRGKLYEPLRGFEELETRVGVNDYRHREIEASGAIGTQFDVTEVEARVQLAHHPLGAWKGVTGVQVRDRDFEAVGAEAFVPPTQTRGAGLFVVEEREFGERHRLELGARVDRLEHQVDAAGSAAPMPPADRDFTTYSLSAGSSFALGEHLHLRLNAQRAQRAPSTEELYAFGPHLATSSYERGDLQLDPEIANNLELSIGRDSGRFTWEASTYYNRIDDFIYLQSVDQGLSADGSGTADSDGVADTVDESGQFDAEGEMLLVDHRQRDAQFYGAELSAGYKLIRSGPLKLDLRAFGDTVRGEFVGGGNLPRMTPSRFGVGANARIAALSGDVSYQRTLRQEHTAELETDTPGYDLLSADLGYALQWGRTRATFYVRGRNLLDEKIRLATSFLKDVAPLPGRSIFTGLRIDFAPPV